MPSGPPQHAKIDRVWIDVSIREVHSRSADMTTHPVERGTDVTDHVRPHEPELSIEGLITNTPIEVPQSHLDGSREDPSPILIEGEPSVGVVGLVPGVDQGVALAGVIGLELRSPRQFSANPLHFTTPFDRVSACWNALQQIVADGRPVVIETALQRYENVVLVDLQCNRERPGALEFGATGRVLRTVDSRTTNLTEPTPTDARDHPKKSAGKKSTKDVSPGSKDPLPESLLSKVVKALSL